jgi:hypothetical protein
MVAGRLKKVNKILLTGIKSAIYLSEMSKEPETKKQLVTPGVEAEKERALKRWAEEYNRPLAFVMRKVIDVALDHPKWLAEAIKAKAKKKPALKGGGGNRTRSLTQLAAA